MAEAVDDAAPSLSNELAVDDGELDPEDVCARFEAVDESAVAGAVDVGGSMGERHGERGRLLIGRKRSTPRGKRVQAKGRDPPPEIGVLLRE